MAADLAQVDDVQNAWRPLTGSEKDRAQYLLGLASRKVYREHPHVEDLIGSGALAAEDVVDVVVGLVLQALPLTPHPGARTWQVSSGAESRSITLGAASGDPNAMVFTDWMLDILQPDPAGAGSATAVFSAPPAEGWPDPYHRTHQVVGWWPS